MHLKNVACLLLASAAAAAPFSLYQPRALTPDAFEVHTQPPLTVPGRDSRPASSGAFVNFESPHVSPLDLTPDGTQLLAVNTGDNRLQVFDVTPTGLVSAGSVPVGLEPVTVRARTNTEAWVVNHVSDSVSIVDLQSLHVVGTIFPGDEPADVVFAGAPERAFVSVSQENRVLVFDTSDLSLDPTVIEIAGEEPKALATDGSRVYAAIFESGNNTTVIDHLSVSNPAFNPYPGDPNPPPNVGADFVPPINPDNPPAPRTGLIVKKDANGAWLDDNGGDWSAAVTWDLHDHDVAVIDATTLDTDYAIGTMNLNMAMGVDPLGGVTVVGTDAINEVRFEPNLNGIFVRVMGACVTADATTEWLADLNPHLDYTTERVDQATRDLAIGDPRGVVWQSDGSRAFITGMGSNNVLVTDPSLVPTDRIEVGEGPTGIRIDAADERLFVLNKFAGSISVIDALSHSVLEEVSFYDPTPAAIVAGRPFLYDTHLTSGLGQASCGSCHIDGRMDQLAWDLGDPAGEEKPFNQQCRDDFNTNCEDWHPMKGPLTTQTFVNIIDGTEPFHWRGDREDLAAFNPAFVGLLGDDTELTDQEMTQFNEFVRSLRQMPNPNRNLDSTLPDSFPNGGNPARGAQLYLTGLLDNPFNCVDCHSVENGTDPFVTSAVLDQTTQSINSPHLLNIYEKTGFEFTSQDNNRGFGFIHDGSFDTLFSFFSIPAFSFRSDQQRHDIIAFMMSFSDVTHAGIGAQLTLPATADGARTDYFGMLGIAGSGEVGLVAKGLVNGEHRGYFLIDGLNFQSDRAAEQISIFDLQNLASEGQELTLTLVPAGSEVRIGVDRDEDGHYDRDEIDGGYDPADPDDCPTCCPADTNGDGTVDTRDFIEFLGLWSAGDTAADTNEDGIIDTRDFILYLQWWSTGC